MDFEHLPPNIQSALHAILNGATADSVESEVLEFKEDPSHHPHATNPAATLYEKLIDESICFANSDGASGHIIVGVADKIAGKDAFTGTEFDAQDVARRIFNNTKPNLRVEVSEFFFAGQRLLLIYIPEALTLYTRTKGQASKRIGSSCEPLGQAERQAIIEARANSDFSNRVSQRHVEDIRLDTLNETRRLLREKRSHGGKDPAIPDTTPGLLRELGLTTDTGLLKKAGEILLLPMEGPDVSVRHLFRPIPGAAAQATELNGPLIEVLARVQRLITDNSSQELDRLSYDDGQEVVIPHFPHAAIDEVLSNALIHRDWRLSNPVIIDQTPKVIKVWSPGGLPHGVRKDNLLTTQSIPRNNRLMAAMRALGLAEEHSRGFDRMWASFLATGRDTPEVRVTDDFVEILLSAGQPDHEFIRGLHALEADLYSSQGQGHPADLIRSLNVLIVLWHLWSHPILTIATLRELAQIPKIEATELMDYLSSLDITQRVRDADEWVLGDRARRAMKPTPGLDIASVTITEWLQAQLEDGVSIAAAEAAEKLGVDRKEITDHLIHLRRLGRVMIDPTGPQRGKNTRWISVGSPSR